MPINNYFLPILFSLFSLSVFANNNECSSATQTESMSSITETMYYIFITESKNHKELFPKLYPIGYVMKEKDEKGKKTRYLLGEFKTMPEAEEALKIVVDSGYTQAKIISR